MARAGYTPPAGGPTYTSAVNAYVTAALNNQRFGWTQTNATPFTYVTNGAADVRLSANVPTAFMKIVSVAEMPVEAVSHCYDTPAMPPTPSPYLVQEGFEARPCHGCYTYFPAPGTSMATSNSGFSSTPTYTGTNGTAWHSSGHCLETDSVGIISSSVPEGSMSAELDCDNGSNTRGNSAISTKIYMAAGNYELRYHYRSRVGYPNYDPTYLCGSAASDLAWANDTNSSGGPVSNVLRTNQMNVYLDPNTTGTPPLHTTLDGGQQLAGSNLIDMCVYSTTWVERSVRIYVTSPNNYWLTFAADGRNESFGAQLDNIRLCSQTCPGTVADNFPAAWRAANNNGVNKILFEDRFESPTYTANGCGSFPCATNGNMNLSLGTSGTSASGWPSQAASGWATAPYNQMDYWLADAVDGSRSIDLDASVIGAMTTSNRLTSRPFLLAPGYYEVSYYYRSTKALSGVSGVYCGATPTAARVNTGVPAGYDTNFFASFMAHSDLASLPIGGGALNSETSYKNPNGTTTTTPTVPPNALSLSSYNAAQPNPLLDICGYGTAWQLRTANIRITKPAYYWLTLSALGTADNNGAQIDRVETDRSRQSVHDNPLRAGW